MTQPSHLASRLKTELDLFFTALTFLSRLPAPKCIRFKHEYLSRSIRYFPLSGSVIGALSALICYLLWPYFSPAICVLSSMIFSLFITGAFHEDGFADFCDGFGGGWEKEQILNIMKDSRLGTYAAAGLFGILTLKLLLLIELNLNTLILTIITGHTLSRFIAASIVYNYPYSQLDTLTKVKPLAQNMSDKELVIALIPSVLSLTWLPIAVIFPLVIALAVFRLVFARYLLKKIDGYTGDCLGTAQQLSEIMIYIAIVGYLS
jgi:adenosylcobinamide-GDP ribazoletransferase